MSYGMKCVAEKSNNVALVEAVEEGDILSVYKLLVKGADPNYRPKSSHLSRTVVNLAVQNNEHKIVELLVERGGIVGHGLIKNIFKLELSLQNVEKLLESHRNVNVLGEIFLELVCKYEGPAALGMLKFLLDHGLPVDEYIEFSTPLHYSVATGKIDFVTLLLQRGADIHKLTMKAESCLWLAVKMSNIRMVKLLLKKGVNVNERISSEAGVTALHKACEGSHNAEMIHLLLEYGADVSILDDDGYTPFASSIGEAGDGTEILLKELALMKFEGREISPGNWKIIKLPDESLSDEDESFLDMFDRCIEELEEMKDVKIYRSLTLFDILKMKRQRRKLTLLAKNKEFVKKFNSCWDRELYEYYGDDLDDIFDAALKRRYILQSREKKLYSIFKDHLPELVIRKVAYFANESLFYLYD